MPVSDWALTQQGLRKQASGMTKAMRLFPFRNVDGAGRLRALNTAIVTADCRADFHAGPVRNDPQIVVNRPPGGCPFSLTTTLRLRDTDRVN